MNDMFSQIMMIIDGQWCSVMVNYRWFISWLTRVRRMVTWRLNDGWKWLISWLVVVANWLVVSSPMKKPCPPINHLLIAGKIGNHQPNKWLTCASSKRLQIVPFGHGPHTWLFTTVAVGMVGKSCVYTYVYPVSKYIVYKYKWKHI